MRVFIIMYNRLTYPKAMCEFLADTGCEPVLVDNHSTYEPLLDWYRYCPYRFHRMQKNWGHQVVWKSGLIDTYPDRHYIVTDHDLDISMIPKDYVNMLYNGLNLFPNVIKSGLSLCIDDLPENEFTKRVIEWESKFWHTKRENGFFLSDIDTTFAMYDRERDFGELPNNRFFSAVRADRPYTARHLPWYNTKEFIESNEEERYYQEHTNTYWSEIFKTTI